MLQVRRDSRVESTVDEPGLGVLGTAEARDSRRSVLSPAPYSARMLIVCLVVDNHRVLHGRSAFTGKRRMCGAYVGMDEYKSKLAVLAERYGPAQQGEAGDSEIFNGRSIWSPTL